MVLNQGNIIQYIRKGKCAKQTTIAIVVNDNRAWIGTNWCNIPQDECPRSGMPTGIGYDLCIEKCHQNSHAEVDACHKAKENANGAILYLIGHTYCCDNCKKTMEHYGISKVIIGEFPSQDLEIIG